MGSSMVQGLWGFGADELLELLEEEISKDILDQMKATKNPEKKSKKTANKLSRKLNEQNTKKKEQKNDKKFRN